MRHMATSEMLAFSLVLPLMIEAVWLLPWPGMLDAWFGKRVVREPRHTVPGHAVSLAASPKRSPPKISNMVPKHYERPAVCRDRVVGEMARHDLPRPFPLFGDRRVPTSLQLLLQFLELCPSTSGVEAAALFGLENLRRKRMAVRSLRKVTAGAPRFRAAATAIAPSLDRSLPVAEPLSHKYSFFCHPFWVCWLICGGSMTVGDVNRVNPTGGSYPSTGDLQGSNPALAAQFEAHLQLARQNMTAGQRYALSETPWQPNQTATDASPPHTARPATPPDAGRNTGGATMRPITTEIELPGANPLKGIASGSARLLGGAALRATGAGGVLLDSTGPAGKTREYGTTSEGDRVIVDDRTINIHYADGTRRLGFLNGDGNSWGSADGKLVARRDSTTGKIEIAPPCAKPASPLMAGGNPSNAGRQQPTGINQPRRNNLEGIEIRSREEQEFVNGLSPHLTREQVQAELEGFRRRNGTADGAGGAKPPTNDTPPAARETAQPLGPGEMLSRHLNGDYGLLAELDRDGILKLAIFSDNKHNPPLTPRGGEMFDEAMRAFGPNVKGIRGNWFGTDPKMSDNFDSFKAALKSGLPPEEAALHTFTGHMAAKWGFTHATVVLNDAEMVIVEFRR
jgi:hypothetical protein